MEKQRNRKIGKKGIMILGTLVIAAIVVSAGFIGGWFMQSSVVINVENLESSVTINGNAIPYSESKIYNVSAGDSWNESYTVANNFSKDITVYLNNTFNEESLSVLFYVDDSPVTEILVPSGEIRVIVVEYVLNILTDCEQIAGGITFSSSP